MSARLDVDGLTRTFDSSVERYRQAEPIREDAERSALYLLAGHAMTFAPEATHMLIETSDQGRYMWAPNGLEDVDRVDFVVGREQEWEDLVEDADLIAVASWLPWGGDWEEYADDTHPYHNPHGGYFALDLRRIAQDAS